MIIDIHGHYHPKAYNEAISGFTRGAGGFPGHPDTDDEEHIQTRLKMMADAGVGMQVLSPAAGRAPYSKDEAEAVNAARIGNDIYYQLEQRFPDKFRNFVSLPLPHIDASVKELRRGMDELGMVGINMHISALDRSVAEDEFLPIYEEVDKRKGIIFYHPSGNGICSPMITDYGFSAAVGTSLEDAVIGLHLVGKQIPEKYPNITYVIPHLGGPLPMLLDRLNNQFSMKAHGLPEHPKDTLRRFFYDTVGHGSYAALTCAVMAFGADHVLPGSDFPVLLSYETYKDTFSWIREAGLSDADVDQILNKTAQDLLGLKV